MEFSYQPHKDYIFCIHSWMCCTIRQVFKMSAQPFMSVSQSECIVSVVSSFAIFFRRLQMKYQYGELT